MAEHSVAEEEGTFQKVPSPSKKQNDPDANVVFFNCSPVLLAQPLTVVRAVTSTGGARVLAPPVKQEESPSHDSPPLEGPKMQMIKVKEEKEEEEFETPHVSPKDKAGFDVCRVSEDMVVMETQMEEEPKAVSSVKEEEEGCEVAECRLSFDDFLKATNTKVASEDDEYLKSMAKQESEPPPIQTKQEGVGAVDHKVSVKKEEVTSEVEVLKVNPFEGLKRPSNSKSKVVVKKEKVEEKILNLEDGEFPEEPGWFLMGRKVEVALSTTKGRKLVDNEIVHFNFPLPTSSYKSQWIVRISTKRSGEVGRLPMEWAKTVIPLVQSAKVKVRGRCIAAPYSLQMMQEIMLLVSFYIHHSIFTDVLIPLGG